MIFGDVGSGEILLLALVAVFVFGPDRLPKLARDLGRALRQVRGMANSVRDDIRDEVGPEIADFDLSTLNPKTFVTKHLFSDEDVSSLDNALSLDKSLDKGPSGVGPSEGAGQGTAAWWVGGQRRRAARGPGDGRARTQYVAEQAARRPGGRPADLPPAGARPVGPAPVAGGRRGRPTTATRRRPGGRPCAGPGGVSVAARRPGVRSGRWA